MIRIQMGGLRRDRLDDIIEKGSSADGMSEFIGEDGMLKTLDIFQKIILCVLVGCAAIPVNILGMSLGKRN